MQKGHFIVERYMRCGEMPLFLVFLKDGRGNHSHCVMLATYKNLRTLLRQRKGFSDPAKFGRLIYSGRSEVLNDMVRHMLRERYGFDISESDPVTVH